MDAAPLLSTSLLLLFPCAEGLGNHLALGLPWGTLPFGSQRSLSAERIQLRTRRSPDFPPSQVSPEKAAASPLVFGFLRCLLTGPSGTPVGLI
ncbi:hypothetical protein FKM82_029842 [Ascaphus truei]